LAAVTDEDFGNVPSVDVDGDDYASVCGNEARLMSWVVNVMGCHTPFRERGNEASIRVPRMFKSHAWQQYDKQM
jgi:hypothetical protein